MKHFEIESIIPASDWYAVLHQEKDPYFSLVPLVCWGLGKCYSYSRDYASYEREYVYKSKEGDVLYMQRIKGMMGGKYISIVDELDNFVEYIHGSKLPLSQELIGICKNTATAKAKERKKKELERGFSA